MAGPAMAVRAQRAGGVEGHTVAQWVGGLRWHIVAREWAARHGATLGGPGGLGGLALDHGCTDPPGGAGRLGGHPAKMAAASHFPQGLGPLLSVETGVSKFETTTGVRALFLHRNSAIEGPR